MFFSEEMKDKYGFTFVFCCVCCYPRVLAHLISIFCASRHEADNISFLLFAY